MKLRSRREGSARALILCVSLVAAATQAESALLAYFPFDSDFNDASGNGNHLSIVEGAPTIVTDEGSFVFGRGALETLSSVTDRSYLELAEPLTFAADAAWSVAFWARRSAGSDDRQGMVVGDTANAQDFIWLSNNPAQVQGLRFRSTDNSNFNYDVGPDDGAWHHWALAADGTGNLTVYRDNVLLGSSAGTTSFSLKNVAHAYNTMVHSMNGQIDELHIYDEEIDAAMVEGLFLGTGGADFRITEVQVGDGGNSVTLTWNSVEGRVYAVRASRALVGWDFEFDDSIEADAGDRTTRTFDLTALELAPGDTLFFRVELP